MRTAFALVPWSGLDAGSLPLAPDSQAPICLVERGTELTLRIHGRARRDWVARRKGHLKRCVHSGLIGVPFIRGRYASATSRLRLSVLCGGSDFVHDRSWVALTRSADRSVSRGWI